MKTLALTIIIAALSLLISKSFLATGFPYTHDGENHLARFAQYRLAVRQGQIPPRWAPNLFNGYGYPVFNYNYPLANVLSLPFSFLRFNPETTFKLLVVFGSFWGVLGVYRWQRSEQKRVGAALFATAVYASSPVLISTLVYRGNIGEFLSLVLLPWMFLQTNSTIKNRKISFFSLVIGTAFLLSHNLLVLFALPILVIFTLLKLKVYPALARTILVYWLLIIGASLWFWLPAIWERGYTVVQEVDVAKGFALHFPQLSQLLAGELKFGYSLPGPVDSMSFQLGVLSWAVLAVATLFAMKSKKEVLKEKTNLAFLLLLSMYGLFQLSVTLPIWQMIPVSRMIQFPWRLSLFILILLLPLASWVWSGARSSLKIFLLIILATQLLIVMRIKPVDYFHKETIDYEHFALSTSVQHENRSKQFEYGAYEASKIGPTLLGAGSATVQTWNGTSRTYQLTLDEESIVIEETMNFPGWRTEVVSSDGAQPRVVEYQNSDLIQGRVAYSLPAGTYQVSTEFTQLTPARIIGNMVTVLSLSLGVFISFRKKSQI